MGTFCGFSCVEIWWHLGVQHFVAWLEVWPEYGPNLVAFRGIGL